MRVVPRNARRNTGGKKACQSFCKLSFRQSSDHEFFWRWSSFGCLIAKILSPWLGDIVDSGIGLSCRPASLCSLADRYDNPMPESTISPRQGLRVWLLDSDKFFFSICNLRKLPKNVVFVWAKTLIWPLYCKGQRPWRLKNRPPTAGKRQEDAMTMMLHPSDLRCTLHCYWAKQHSSDLLFTLWARQCHCELHCNLLS